MGLLQPGHRIAWLDSVRMPSRIHRTTNGGRTTICGHRPKSERHWEIAFGGEEIPRAIRGSSRYCRTCFKQGGKTLPWLQENDSENAGA